jgi:hypothetical protein
MPERARRREEMTGGTPATCETCHRPVLDNEGRVTDLKTSQVWHEGHETDIEWTPQEKADLDFGEKMDAAAKAIRAFLNANPLPKGASAERRQGQRRAQADRTSGGSAIGMAHGKNVEFKENGGWRGGPVKPLRTWAAAVRGVA